MGGSVHHWAEIGQLPSFDASLDESDDQTVKATPGSIIDIVVSNEDATAVAYLKFRDATTYDVSAAVPTYSFMVPALTTLHLDFSGCPIKFVNGISIAAAKEAGTGATAPDTDLVVNVRYA